MSFTPTLDKSWRFWEVSRAAIAAPKEQQAEIWKHWDGFGPLEDGTPQPGYYWMRRGFGGKRIPVAIWIENGAMIALSARETQENPERIWLKCGRNPISGDEYRFAVEHGRFPGEIEAEPIRFDDNAEDPNAKYRQDMVSLMAEVEGFLKKLPDPVTKEGADALENYRQLISQAQKDAGERLEAAIAANKIAIAKEKEIWSIPLTAATDLIGRIKAVIKPFLLAAAAEGAPVKLGGQGTGAGRARRSGLRTVWKARIIDWEKAVKAFSEHEDVVELVQKLADRAARDKELRKEPIDGVEFYEDQTV